MSPPRPRRGTAPEPREDSIDPDTGELLTPMTAAQVEAEIVRLSQNMDVVTEQLRGHAQDMAVTDNAYVLAKAKAMTRARATLEGDGPGGRVTVDQALSFAYVECADERLAKIKAAAIYEVDKELLRSTRSQIDALRTIAANIRAQT